MRGLVLAVAVAAACGVGFVAGHVSADEEGGGGFQIPGWMQMGKEHEGFKRSVGTWDVAQKMWLTQGQPPLESKAWATSALLWDGRFLQTEFHGAIMDVPFDGRLLMGFDRVDKEYVAVWIDSLSTYMSVSYGKEKDGEVTFKLNDPDVKTGRKKKTDMVMRWIDDDTYTLTFVDTSGEGEPHATMQMTYVRRKR